MKEFQHKKYVRLTTLINIYKTYTLEWPIIIVSWENVLLILGNLFENKINIQKLSIDFKLFYIIYFII